MSSFTFREPVGIVGLITPWNFPIAFTTWTLAPALAAGYALLASFTPLNALRLAELALVVGIPEGVFNVVPGPGATAGRRLAGLPRISR